MRHSPAKNTQNLLVPPPSNLNFHLIAPPPPPPQLFNQKIHPCIEASGANPDNFTRGSELQNADPVLSGSFIRNDTVQYPVRYRGCLNCSHSYIG